VAEFGAIGCHRGYDHELLQEIAGKLDEARAQLRDLSGVARLRL
jgi:hypothetical protein